MIHASRLSRLTRAGLVGAVVVIAVLAGSHIAATISLGASPAASPRAGGGANATSLASQLDAATTHAAGAAAPSVVLVESSGGLGSGEIVDPRGYIVTNYHVLAVQSGTASRSATYRLTLANGRSYQASIRGTDAQDDLAVLKISAPGLRAISLGDSSRLQVGQFVLAVGNPLGYSQTVTFGIVSTLNRSIEEQGPAALIPDMIQTSAPINPGNSGGALVDLQGRLVGVPTLAAQNPEQGSAAQGIGFAIPVNRVRFIADQIIRYGTVRHSGRPYLGIGNFSEVNASIAAQYGLGADNGILIGRVQKGGPADRAGIRAGDVLVSLNGRATLSQAAFDSVLASLKPKQTVKATVVRQDGKSRTVTIHLGELPVSAS